MRAVAALAMIALGASAAEPAQEPRASIFDLQLGATAAQQIPAQRFDELACGNDGGPPMRRLKDWTDFAQCPPDAYGLYEVTFRYDDEAEMAARAGDDVAAAWGLGTSLDYFPVIVSSLFDREATLVGLRIVTDPRFDPSHETFLRLRPRGEHYLLGLYLMDRFGLSEDDCRDLEPAEGETPVLGMFAKRRCEATADGRLYWVESRLFRRPGETDVDPVMGTLTDGQFLSETRAEIRLVNPR